MAKATFGAGCFWGRGGVPEDPGGPRDGRRIQRRKADNPTYKDVCTDTTGHAEVVEVDYDPDRVSYDALLDVFWNGHNPTQLNRQGPDVGTQYRSAIFFHTPEQEAAARASKEQLQKSGRFPRPVVTEISPAQTFWRAEDYHQQYLAKRGLGSCHV
jgi:peptide-methionine (S)-S-oxide reductase